MTETEVGSSEASPGAKHLPGKQVRHLGGYRRHKVEWGIRGKMNAIPG